MHIYISVIISATYLRKIWKNTKILLKYQK